jgi:hypothetical protein
VNVSLQPTTFQRSDDVTILSANYKHTYNRNNYEHEDQVTDPNCAENVSSIREK